MANKLNLNVLISSPLRVISLYFIFVFPSRSVRQLHATGRPRIPQLPAEHSGWHPAGGEEAGKAERTPQEQRHHRHHGGRDGEQDWANMGSRYLPRHPDQWDPLPQLWNSMCGSAPHQYILCPCVTLNKSSLLNKSEKGISLLQRCWEMLKRFSVRTRWAPATHFTSGLQMVLSSQVWGRGVGRVALNNPCKHRTDTKATQFNKHFKDWLSVCVCVVLLQHSGLMVTDSVEADDSWVTSCLFFLWQVSSKDEDFLDLSVDVEQNTSITHCLR